MPSEILAAFFLLLVVDLSAWEILASSFSQTDAKVITLGSFFLLNSCLVYATTTLCELSVKQTFSLKFVTRVLFIEKEIRAFFFF